MHCYTNHGESFQLDNLKGKSFGQALKLSKSGKYKLEVIDSLWREDVPPGLVLSQNPLPKAQIKKGRTVYLTMSSGTIPLVKLPQLFDASYDYNSYKRMLEMIGLNAEIKTEIFDNKEAKGTIKSVLYKEKRITEGEIKKGVEVPKGSSLSFVITKRQTQERSVPDLICSTTSDARFQLDSKQLNADIIEDSSVGSIGEAYVYKQVPSYGEILIAGEYVKLYVTAVKPSSCN